MRIRVSRTTLFACGAITLGSLIIESQNRRLFAQDSSGINTKIFLKKDYKELRNVLLAKGWQPDNTSSSHSEFKEISCGTRGDCVAFWSKPRGREAFVGIDELQKPYKVMNVEFKQTVSEKNGGVLTESYCLGTFSTIGSAKSSGDLSGFEVSVRGSEIDFVVAEGDVIGTKVRDFSVSGNKLEFTVWGKPFSAECSGKGLARKELNKSTKKIDSEFMERRSFLSSHPSIVKWEDNTPDKETEIQSAPADNLIRNKNSPNIQKGGSSLVMSPELKVETSPVEGAISLRIQSRTDGILRINEISANRGNCKVFDIVSYVDKLSSGLFNAQLNGNLKLWLSAQGYNTRSFNDPLKFGEEATFFAACNVVEVSIQTNFGTRSFTWE